MDETPKFEPYQPVRVSKLEALRSEIAEMSRQGWPLKKIREFLEQERKVKVSVSRLCVYCQSRNILKGRGEVAAPKAEEASREREGGKKERGALARDREPESLAELLPPGEPGNPFTKFKPKQ